MRVLVCGVCTMYRLRILYGDVLDLAVLANAHQLPNLKFADIIFVTAGLILL